MIDLSLLQDFIAESEEHLEEMEAGLLKLESEPDNQETLNDVFRTAHSIKGSAEYIGAEKTALLSHKLENLLEAIRQGKKVLNDKIINALMDARDRILALIEDLGNNKEEKTDIADIMERIENLSADNDGAKDDGAENIGLDEDKNYTNERDEEIVELTNFAIEPPEDNGITESANVVDETCREGDGGIIELTDIAADDSCKDIDISSHPLFGDGEMETSKDITITPHPLFGDGETDMNPEIGERVAYEDDNDEELFDIFLEHLKENILSIKGLAVKLPGSDNSSDLLIKYTNAILSLKSSANYMDFMELVDVYEEWLSSVEKFQEEMFLAEVIGFEDFFTSVKNYLDRIAAFFPGHKELCLDFDVPDHESIESGVKEAEAKVPKTAAPDDSADASAGLECEDGEDEKENEEELCLLEQESAVEQDYAEAVNDLEALDGESSVSVEAEEDMPNEIKVEAEFFDKEPDEAQGVLDEERIDSAMDVSAGISGDNCPEEDPDDVCFLFNGQDSVLLGSREQYEREPFWGDESVPELSKDEEAISLLEQESAVEQDYTEAVNDLEALDGESSVSVEAEEDMPNEVKVKAEFSDKEPDEAQGILDEEQIDSAMEASAGISEDNYPEEDPDDACFLFNGQDSVLPESMEQIEGDESEPDFFNKESETKLSSYEESPSGAVVEETDFTPLSEASVVSEGIDQGVNKVAASGENYPAAGQDDFAKDLQPKQESEPQAEPEPVKQVAAGKELSETRISKENVRQSVRQSVRVDAVKIDALMNQAGELVVSRAGFSQILNEMKELQQELNDNAGLYQKEFKHFKDLTFRLGEATATLGRVANELQEGVMKVRMLPISQLFNRYPRLVRDLVHGINKKVRLEIAGEETELDKMVIQEIADPIVHIIRNAVDHGIETVPERLKAGKPEEGVLKLTSYHESNHVVVEITDDGRGINPVLIKEVALKKGLFTAQELERMTVKDLIGILMIPGFSTAAEISKTSGRGVGMDVVKQNIEKLNGTIEIDSKPGSGSRLRIKIPLTLAIIKALMVRIGKDIFTIPLAAVEETMQIMDIDISVIEGVEVIHLRNSVLSLLRLSSLFRIDAAPQVADKEFVVVINTGLRQVGLIVDALMGQEEVVIKPLADYLQDNSGFSGATILGDGSISLILDVYELINMAMDMQAARRERFKYSGAPVNSFEQVPVENYEGHQIH